jgi:hypothetical protein
MAEHDDNTTQNDTETPRRPSFDQARIRQIAFDLDDPLGNAEAAIHALSLLSQEDGEVSTKAVCYLASRLHEHVAKIEDLWQELFRLTVNPDSNPTGRFPMRRAA